jgi:hypothetical protein
MSIQTLPRSGREGTIGGMAKKKTGGEHKTQRVAVQIPETWMKVLRRLAGKERQPSLWFLLSLIGERADAEKVERPAYPWDEEEK